jgi:hypothetical protein
MATWHLSVIAADTSGLGRRTMPGRRGLLPLRMFAASAVHAAFMPDRRRDARYATGTLLAPHGVSHTDETFAAAEICAR